MMVQGRVLSGLFTLSPLENPGMLPLHPNDKRGYLKAIALFPRCFGSRGKGEHNVPAEAEAWLDSRIMSSGMENYKGRGRLVGAGVTKKSGGLRNIFGPGSHPIILTNIG